MDQAILPIKANIFADQPAQAGAGIDANAESEIVYRIADIRPEIHLLIGLAIAGTFEESLDAGGSARVFLNRFLPMPRLRFRPSAGMCRVQNAGFTIAIATIHFGHGSICPARCCVR